jgi:pyruvate dehydrogenase E2 component (dihydrolipoamide acetyltransferase)
VAVEVFIPKMTDFMEEGTIIAWLVAEGDHVDEGQPLLEIETDKATAEMEASATGYLVGIRPGAVPGAVIPVGETIAYIAASPNELVEALPAL